MVVRDRNWRLELFVVIDGVVWTRSQRAESGWSGWEPLGAPEGQEVSWVVAAQTRERSLHLFPGEQLDTPSLVLNAKGRLELWFAIQNTMDLYRLKQTAPNGTRWTGERFSSEEPVTT